MPEGPSIVILKELVQEFKGHKVLEVTGNTKVGKERLLDKTVVDFKSWGKHFLIQFDDFTVRIHFLLFGSYLINDTKSSFVRLGLHFGNGFINFYTCGVRFLEGDPDQYYDWSADIMSDDWNERKAKEKLLAQPDMLVCDALLNQDIFSGSGNIIKNEVLFRIGLHPENRIAALPEARLEEMIRETRIYSFQFLEWKKAFVLRKHWEAHTKLLCPRCELPFEKRKTGRTKRRSFFCEKCQVLYS